MIRIIIYLLTILGVLTLILLSALSGSLPPWIMAYRTPLYCAITGGLGGVIYCLRGVYLNACVRKQWDFAWWPWYFIRPIVSVCTGLASYLFLRAGLLILEASKQQDS